MDTLLKESLNTLKLIKSTQKGHKMTKTCMQLTKILEFASYRHITGETLKGWTQTAERMT